VMNRLEMRQVSFAYSKKTVLRDINLVVGRGEMVGLLGPNGSGKTTLVKLVSGILRPGGGEVTLDGINLSRLRRRAVARTVAVVPQQFHVPFAFTCRDIVMLGRTPFIRPLAGETGIDRRLVEDALVMAGVSGMEERRFDELSGGERQRVILAMALAQQPELLLLDEPTLHLDIAHQTGMLELVRGLNAGGMTVIAAIHDLNLAALYFDRLILLEEGAVRADGPPAAVLTEDIISEVYNAPVRVERHPITGAPNVFIVPGDVSKSRPPELRRS
jgi:iron complex transport system ATP-binding protein